MIFLTVVAWAVFIFLSLIFIVIVHGELTGTGMGRKTKGIRTTYWNHRMFVAVIVWLAAGTFIFW
jgi:hypothetical protein